jgi:16S rRNA (guanine1207-N2)-methyltransferase
MFTSHPGDRVLAVYLRGVRLSFETSPRVFSPRSIDPGTAALVESLQIEPDDRVLDLGCGYGVLGVLAARIIGQDRVVMADVDPEAIRLAVRNCRRNDVAGVAVHQSHALRNVPETGFTKILCNPPYHTDFSVAKEFILKGFNRLALGGQMVLVVRRRRWYENKLRRTFGGVRIEIRGPYSILRAERREHAYASSTRSRRASNADG